MKIWRGPSYEEKAYDQLADYLESQEQEKGWLVSFCGNKKDPQEDRIFSHKGLTINETVIAYRMKE